MHNSRLAPAALLFALALALRLSYLALAWNGPLGNADSAAYRDLALSLAHKQPYHADQSAGPGGFPTDLQRPPGYPVFLAAVNSRETISYRRTAVIQCALGALFVFLAVYFCARVDPKIGLFAGLFCAIDWVTIVHTPMLIAETVFSFNLGVAILLYMAYFVKPSVLLALGAGLFLGFAALIKPAAQLVVIAFVVSWLFQKNKNGKGLLFLLTFVACITPWIARNQHKYGVLTLSEIGTADLYFYTAQGSLHHYPFSDLPGNEITKDVNQLDRYWRSQPISEHERSSRMRREALRIIAIHWPVVLKQAAIGLARSCTGTGYVTAYDSMHPSPGPIFRLTLIVLPLVEVGALWMFAIYGTYGCNLLIAPIRALLIAATLCILLPAAAPLAQSRFRVPAVPELSALAAAGLVRFRSRYSAVVERSGSWLL